MLLFIYKKEIFDNDTITGPRKVLFKRAGLFWKDWSFRNFPSALKCQWLKWAKIWRNKNSLPSHPPYND